MSGKPRVGLGTVLVLIVLVFLAVPASEAVQGSGKGNGKGNGGGNDDTPSPEITDAHVIAVGDCNGCGSYPLTLMTETGDERVVLFEERKVDDRDPDWSPDGEWLVFRRDFPPNVRGRTDAGLNVIRTDGSGETHLVVPGELGYGTRPDWSPNGEWIAYSWLAGGTLGIGLSWIEDLDTGTLIVHGPYELWELNSDGAIVTDPAWAAAPNGRMAAETVPTGCNYQECPEQYDIIIFDVLFPSSPPENPTGAPLVDVSGIQSLRATYASREDPQELPIAQLKEPAWSPAAPNQIAFKLNYTLPLSDMADEIWAADVSGSCPALSLTADLDVNPEDPEWSADGTRIVFTNKEIFNSSPAGVFSIAVTFDNDGCVAGAGDLTYLGLGWGASWKPAPPSEP